MPSFKDPSLQDRIALAGQAKQKAIDQLKARPPIDALRLAEQRKAWEARQKELTDSRAAKAGAKAAAKAEKASKKAAELAATQEAAALKTARLTPTSAADMKAARDARYAARKVRR